ncbi:16S rRNA (guanine(527)-N(7))-methyltransferase RsmG [Chloroflexota bacterium]
MEKLSSGAEKLGLPLNKRQLEQFHIYYQELVDWNQRMNLTRITDYNEVQIGHFLDSLTVTLVLKPPVISSSFNVIDVGSGAGLPGIPLKIMLPDIKLVLLEATAKKADFLRHLRDKLELDDVEIMVGRAESAAHQVQYREKFEVVLSRAVASLPVLVELALPFAVPGGCFIAQKKGDIEGEVRRASRAIDLFGGCLREVKDIDLEEFTDRRRLVIIDKVMPTPPQYPRHPGIPSKRPILDKLSEQ